MPSFIKIKQKKDTVHEYLYLFVLICHLILHRMRNISDKVVQNIKTHFIYDKFFFRKSFHLCYHA